jgi:hypothetical protein
MGNHQMIRAIARFDNAFEQNGPKAPVLGHFDDPVNILHRPINIVQDFNPLKSVPFTQRHWKRFQYIPNAEHPSQIVPIHQTPERKPKARRIFLKSALVVILSVIRLPKYWHNFAGFTRPIYRRENVIHKFITP